MIYIFCWERKSNGGWGVEDDLTIEFEGSREGAEALALALNGRRFDDGSEWVVAG
jgi:hypothetical protein